MIVLLRSGLSLRADATEVTASWIALSNASAEVRCLSKYAWAPLCSAISIRLGYERRVRMSMAISGRSRSGTKSNKNWKPDDSDRSRSRTTQSTFWCLSSARPSWPLDASKTEYWDEQFLSALDQNSKCSGSSSIKRTVQIDAVDGVVDEFVTNDCLSPK